MSRPISESLSLLSETLGNCKTNLKEKEVADVDNIKISDVDEKIAEIQAGGGGGKAVVITIPDVGQSIYCKELYLSKDYIGKVDTNQYISLYSRNGTSLRINFYELDPSEEKYKVAFDNGEDGDMNSDNYYTFNEAKLYILKKEDISFST